MSRILLCLLFLTSISWAAPAYHETARFDAPEATQAVAVDEGHFYAVDNAQIGKYDKKTGARVAHWQAGPETPLIHMNSGVVFEGRLYCAHSSWPEHPWVSSIEIFDCKTLTHVDSISLGLREGALNWLDRKDGQWWAVFVQYEHDVPRTHPRYVGRTHLARLDAQWRTLEAWLFPPELLERFRPATNSGGSWGSDSTLYCSGHDHAELYRLQLPRTGSTLRFLDTVKAPITGQGFAFDRPSTVLWGIDRPNRQVLRMELLDR